MKKVTVFAAVVLVLAMASPAFARGGRGGCRGGRGGCGGGQVSISQCAPTYTAHCQVVVCRPVTVTTCAPAPAPKACAPVMMSSCGTSCGPRYASSCGSSCGGSKARGGMFRGGRCR